MGKWISTEGKGEDGVNGEVLAQDGCHTPGDKGEKADRKDKQDGT